jgi:zinc transporter 1/2/3
LIGLKLALALAVLAAGALGGAIPLSRRDEGRGTRFLGLGNAFAAGIFLGAGMIHMLPHAGEAWRALGWNYPIAYLLAVLAVVALLLFEHVLLPESAHEMVHHAPSGEPFAHAAQIDGRGGLAPYAVLTALSIHSFLAGLALGAQSAVADALVIFVAIVAHKSTAGFALGVSLVRNRMSASRAWRLLLLFALATPLGILVGAVLDDALVGPTQRAFEATFLALAAGTFTYVALLDILRDEFHGPGDLWVKWSWVAAGSAAMAALAGLV